MKMIYIVQHARKTDAGHDEVKIIGAFGSKQSSETAVNQLKLKPGFKALPNGFTIDEYEIDKIHWAEGFGGDS
jgi:hypothetical protein